MPIDLAAFAQVLATSNETLDFVEAAFKKSCDASSYSMACALISDLIMDGIIGNVATQVEALNCFFICSRIAGSVPEANNVMQLWFVQLEKAIREDSRRLEQFKYRQTAKDSKKYAKDAVDTDSLRCRTALKCFAFQCVLSCAEISQTPNKILSQQQAALDSLLDGWTGDNTALSKKLKALQAAEFVTLGGMSQIGTVSVPSVAPLFCHATPASTPLFAGEAKYIVSSDSPMVLFDANQHPKEWASAKKLLTESTKHKLTPKERQDLMTMVQSSQAMSRMGLSPSSVAEIALHDPEVAAVLLTKIPKPSSHIYCVFSLVEEKKLNCDQLDTIMLHAARVLEQEHMNRYIHIRCTKINELNDDGIVKSFAATLHQLIKKCSKDNKELYISDNRKDEVKAIFEKHNNIPDVATWWSDFK